MDQYETDDIMEPYYNLREVRVYVDTLPINDQIRIKRHADNFTQTQLAQKLKVSLTTLCDIENGHRGIPKNRQAVFESYLYREWYIDRELVDIVEDEGE